MAQVTTGPTGKKAIHLTRDLVVFLIIIIAVASFFAGWYANNYQGGNKTSEKNQTPGNGFTTYTNQQNGFRLDYPDAWGKPNFTTTAVNGGKSYSLQFFKNDKSGRLQYYILLSMLSDTAKGMTGAQIKNLINNNSSLMVVHDESSFVTVASLPKQNTSSMTAYQIVSLNKIGVTAASLTYQITSGSSDCQTNKFTQNSGGACIERSDYNTANTVLKSIKSL